MVLTITDDSDPDWIGAQANGLTGDVPRNYVEEFQEGTSTAFAEWDEPAATGTGPRTSMLGGGRGAGTLSMLGGGRGIRTTIYAQRFETITHVVDDDGYARTDGDGDGDDEEGVRRSSEDSSASTTFASVSAPSASGPAIVRLLYDYEVARSPCGNDRPIRLRRLRG